MECFPQARHLSYQHLGAFSQVKWESQRPASRADSKSVLPLQSLQLPKDAGSSARETPALGSNEALHRALWPQNLPPHPRSGLCNSQREGAPEKGKSGLLSPEEKGMCSPARSRGCLTGSLHPSCGFLPGPTHSFWLSLPLASISQV